MELYYTCDLINEDISILTKITTNASYDIYIYRIDSKSPSLRVDIIRQPLSMKYKVSIYKYIKLEKELINVETINVKDFNIEKYLNIYLCNKGVSMHTIKSNYKCAKLIYSIDEICPSEEKYITGDKLLNNIITTQAHNIHSYTANGVCEVYYKLDGKLRLLFKVSNIDGVSSILRFNNLLQTIPTKTLVINYPLIDIILEKMINVKCEKFHENIYKITISVEYGSGIETHVFAGVIDTI